MIYKRKSGRWAVQVDIDAEPFRLLAEIPNDGRVTNDGRRITKTLAKFRTRSEAEKHRGTLIKDGDKRTLIIEEGARGRRSLGTFATKKEAEKAERDGLTTLERGSTIAPITITVADIIERYNTAREDMGRERKTTTEYRTQARLYVLPHLGDRAISKLRPIHVTDWLSSLKKTGGREGKPLSAKTVHHAYSLLSASLRWAVKQELAGRNVCEQVDPPSIPKSAANAFTLDEVDRILRTAGGTRWEHFISLGLAIGARRAELLALNWSDVNLTSKKVTISKAMSQITGDKPFVKGTKTGSIRTVPLAPIAVEALRRQRIRQKEERLAAGPVYRVDPAEPIFTNEFGERLSPQAATSAFQDIALDAQVSSTRLHDLRHTTASYLLGNGVDIKTVSAILGHANASVTLSVYGHLLEGGMKSATDSLGVTLEKIRGAS